MASYAAVPVAWRTCRHVDRRRSPTGYVLETRYQAADCLLCGGTGFVPIRWTVQLLPDGAQAGSYGNEAAAAGAARVLNKLL